MGFGRNLIELREARGYSRKEFADMLGLPYTTLRNYETDQREPGHKTLIQMAFVLEVSVDRLIGNTAKIGKAPSVSDEALKLAKDYDTLDEWGKKQVRATVDIELERKRCTPSLSERYAEFQTTKIDDQLNVAASGGVDVPRKTAVSGATETEPENLP